MELDFGGEGKGQVVEQEKWNPNLAVGTNPLSSNAYMEEARWERDWWIMQQPPVRRPNPIKPKWNTHSPNFFL
jgi:hypothetical protein